MSLNGGSGKHRVIRDPLFNYLRVDPLPSLEEVEKYYQDEFYSTEYKRFNDSALQIQQEEQEFFNNRWESIRIALAEHFGPLEGRSVFDVGFGFAQALLYFSEKGMRVSGLEPSPEGVEYARSRGLEVYQAGIEDFSCVGSQRFDVVMMLNVLEHLRQPAETLISIRERLLKPGGLLVIDVPNDFNDFQTVADAEFNLGEWWVCPPVHVNYFSAGSLGQLLERCGYEVRRKEAAFPLEMFLLMGDVYVGDSQLGKTCHLKRMAFERLMHKHGKSEKLRRFYEALAGLDLGRQVTVYATY